MASLSVSIRKGKGCKRCDCCQSIEDEDRFFLLEEWNTLENLMAHMKTEHFRITLGAMNLLQEPYERNHFTIKPIRKE